MPSARYLRQRLKGSSRPIKNALLDQALVAGVGNIYADESLFMAGIRPHTPAGRLNAQAWRLLHRGPGEGAGAEHWCRRHQLQ